MDKRKKTKGQTMIYNQKDKQYNGQKKNDQGTNNDLQSEGIKRGLLKTEI
jgi:hypothetical protein